ncbi:MAG TPA: STAS domain-containing protein [Candidatus Polarisedimenticolia bacterium]|nr:STAS domain-containing protein [Candidatus Polarisedimenticolia bacterium]
MALQIASREVDGVAVVALEGRIVFGEESSALRKKVKGLLAGGSKKIVLNVDKVSFLDSSGIGTLVAAYHTAKSHGASLALCCLGPSVEGMLRITKLLTVFSTYKTEADAVRSLAA